MGQLTAAGHVLTPRPEEAEVIVVNTCSFIDPAKQESVDTILEMAEHKKTGQAKKLIVAGCLVERYRGDIQKDLPEVDALVGTNELEKIVALCQGEEPASNPFEPYLYHDLTPRVLATPKHYAYIKISEGCDHPCTFCVIPQYRGANRSRRPESVITEATRLFAPGHSRDQPDRPGHHGVWRRSSDQRWLGAPSRGDSRRSRPRNPKWVRFLYAYPNRVTSRLLETIAAHDSLVKYIDMPLQHASASVLKRMKRGANGDIFLKLLEKVRATIPGVSIRTSFIVVSPVRPRPILKSCSSSSRPRSSTASAYSATPTKTHRPVITWMARWMADDSEPQAQADGSAEEDLARQEPQTDRQGISSAARRPVAGDGSALGVPYAIASAGNRWRLLHQRSR